VWRHPDPLGRSLNIRWAVGGTRGPLFVSIRTGESSHALRRLDPGTGKVLWEDEVRTGPVEDLATDRRKLYAGQRDDDQYWIHGFPTRRGDYKWQLELSRAARDATFPMAASLAAGGGVFSADGAVVYRSEAELGRQWLVARIPEGQHTAPRVAALVAATGDRLFATDTDGAVSRLIAVGRRRRVQWRTVPRPRQRPHRRHAPSAGPAPAARRRGSTPRGRLDAPAPPRCRDRVRGRRMKRTAARVTCSRQGDTLRFLLEQLGESPRPF
jgi:hypothetical protein